MIEKIINIKLLKTSGLLPKSFVVTRDKELALIYNKDLDDPNNAPEDFLKIKKVFPAAIIDNVEIGKYDIIWHITVI